MYVKAGIDLALEEAADLLLRAEAKQVDSVTGKTRGIGGEHPILLAEHLYARKRREIYNETGVADPAFGSGLYNRTHPEGRKVNSDHQRRTNGASFYRRHCLPPLNPIVSVGEHLQRWEYRYEF